MYYIGIVGALSPLGQQVAAFLQAEPSQYKIVFAVDEQYGYPDLVQAQFQNIDQVLARNLNPTLVLDFGPYAGAYERAKLYRKNAIPAVMQAAFSELNYYALRNIGASGVRSPLILVPDFSVVKVDLIENLKAQVKNFGCDVNQIVFEVFNNDEDEAAKFAWLHWAKEINMLLGEFTDKYRQHKEYLTLGYVRLQRTRISSFNPQTEHVSVSLSLTAGKGAMNWSWHGNLLSSRVEGVRRVLKWYQTQITKDVDLAIGELQVDVLPLIPAECKSMH